MEPTLALPAAALHSAAPRALDAWGLALTTSAPSAVRAFERALLALLGHRADTVAHLEAALDADPGLVLAHVVRGFALRLLARGDRLPAAREALAKARRTLGTRGGTLRETLLTDALRAWLEGDVAGCIGSLSRCSDTHPHCLLSMKLHHALCFLHGRGELMLRGLERALPRLDGAVPGRGFALGCYAFALEETGAYAEAEHHARAAIAENEADAWAYHALLHVLTMQDRTRAGLELVRARGERFAGGNNFVAHIAWHHALFAIAERELDEAVCLYDGELARALGPDYRDLANCASLLYRLERAGLDVGARWQALADLAEPRTGDHQLAFADAHYLLALLRAGRRDQAARFLQAMRDSAAGRIDHDAQVMRRAGVPLAEGMFALFSGDAERALRKLWPLGCSALRLGGSHAQRELFEQLAADAALRAGRLSVADQLLANQLETRPGCAWARARARELSALRAQAAATDRVGGRTCGAPGGT
jgi:hypothetical protein